jgi:hypothetical protein
MSVGQDRANETEADMTIAIILNAIFAVGVIVGVVGHLAWAVATQHHDHGVVASGPLTHRRVWSRASRPHAGPVAPWIVKPQRGRIWPAA